MDRGSACTWLRAVSAFGGYGSGASTWALGARRREGDPEELLAGLAGYWAMPKLANTAWGVVGMLRVGRRDVGGCGGSCGGAWRGGLEAGA